MMSATFGGPVRAPFSQPGTPVDAIVDILWADRILHEVKGAREYLSDIRALVRRCGTTNAPVENDPEEIS